MKKCPGCGAAVESEHVAHFPAPADPTPEEPTEDPPAEDDPPAGDPQPDPEPAAKTNGDGWSTTMFDED